LSCKKPFLPLLVQVVVQFQEEQRPLFTIAVLVSGVVGGLAVVIAVVYLYRFCLKKRPPVTTKDTVVEHESTFGSPTRIAQVFPLVPKEHAVPYIQRSVQDPFYLCLMGLTELTRLTYSKPMPTPKSDALRLMCPEGRADNCLVQKD
uniref:Receptor tyrosine kinase-like orphan receptor 2 n=1 Tax=Nippostrongylus brasiliensis TaxID=27835 RepID=A0A0N4YG21_NIPBR